MSRVKYEVAVGLRYDGAHDEVPSLSLSSENASADEIVKIAMRYGIPLVERPELAHALKQLPHDSAVPERLFEAVALVLHQIEQCPKEGAHNGCVLRMNRANFA